MLLPAGEQAPDLVALDQHNERISVTEDFPGKWLVVWWYPKALTPGCSSCGSAFQQSMTEFNDLGAKIIGVSWDSPEDNFRFAVENRFMFPLLSASREDAERWGAMRQESDEWRDYLPRRISYLINPQGIIHKAYLVGDPAGHAAEVMADLREAQPDIEFKFGSALDATPHQPSLLDRIPLLGRARALVGI